MILKWRLLLMTKDIILFTTVFDPPDKGNYHRLVSVFVESIRKHAPHIEVVVQEEDKTKIVNPKQWKDDEHKWMEPNTAKLKMWHDFMMQTDKPTIFADCDMLMTKDPSCAFDTDFDIGWTRRNNNKKSRFRMNGGIIFARPTDKAKEFFTEWLRINNLMYYQDRKLYEKWNSQYFGMNQTAFGYLYENEVVKNILYKEFSCRHWNCIHEYWNQVEQGDVYFVHVKGDLRQVVLGKRRSLISREATPALRQWLSFVPSAKKNEWWPKQ